MDFFILITLIIILIIFFCIINCMLKYTLNKKIENFHDFSPYLGNQLYPYADQKNLDNLLLQDTLKKWEAPFNSNNEGYYNAEPNKIPPLVPIYDYDDRKEVTFPVYDIYDEIDS